jgi:hypothetical protein
MRLPCCHVNGRQQQDENERAFNQVAICMAIGSAHAVRGR